MFRFQKTLAVSLVLALQLTLPFSTGSHEMNRRYVLEQAVVDDFGMPDEEESSAASDEGGEEASGMPDENEEDTDTHSTPEEPSLPEGPEDSGESGSSEEPPEETSSSDAEESSSNADESSAAGVEINATTVLVSSYAELRTALSGNNSYSTFYLAENITADNNAGIAIHPDKTSVVIDGSPPSGGRFTFTQFSVNTMESTIKVNNAAALTTSVMIRNMDIVGKNHYGVVCTLDSIGPNVSITMENINYNGPQPIYHRFGTARFIGGSYTMTDGELAEARDVEIGGTISIQNNTANSVIWLYSTSSTLRFLSGANVDITGAYLVYGNIASATLEAGARVNLTGRRFGFSHAGDVVGVFTIEENAGLTIYLNTTEAYAALRVSREFHMSPGSTATIIRTGAAGIPLRMTAAGAKVVFDRPERVFFYTNASVPLRFTGAGTLDITTSALNIWQTATWPLSGGMDVLPTHIWNKSGNQLLTLSGQYQETVNQSLSHNLTDGDPITSELSSANFNLEKSQLLAFGTQSLAINAPDGGAALSGTAVPHAELLGRFTLASGQADAVTGLADGSGYFYLELPGMLMPDTTVTVLSRAGNLLMRQRAAVPDPSRHRLAFTYIPESTSFGVQPVPGSSSLIARSDEVFGITVEDTRLYPTAWRIDAAVIHPLTTEIHGSTTELPGSVVFIGSSGIPQYLGEVPLPVYRENSGVTGEFPLQWDVQEGVLLELMPGEIYSEAAYTTTIQWTLVDAP